MAGKGNLAVSLPVAAVLVVGITGIAFWSERREQEAAVKEQDRLDAKFYADQHRRSVAARADAAPVDAAPPGWYCIGGGCYPSFEACPSRGFRPTLHPTVPNRAESYETCRLAERAACFRFVAVVDGAEVRDCSTTMTECNSRRRSTELLSGADVRELTECEVTDWKAK